MSASARPRASCAQTPPSAAPGAKLLPRAPSSWENAARRIAAAAKGVCKIVVESTTIPMQTGETMRRILDALAPNSTEVLSLPSFYRGGSALQLLESPEVRPHPAAPSRLDPATAQP